MSTLPLICEASADAPFAYRAGQVLSVRQFIGDVVFVATMLPQRSSLLNLCEDRYRFVVSLAAAMLRGQTALLPPARTPGVLRVLQEDYPDLYCVTDGDDDTGGLEHIAFPGATPIVPAQGDAVHIPRIPGEHIAAIAFTSGSTGRPTAHPKLWRSLVQSVVAEAAALGIEAGTGIVGTVPPQHMYGLESTVLIALRNGLAIHAARPFYPEDIRRALAELPSPRMLVTTPLHLRAVLEAGVQLPPLAQILCATAPLSQQLAAQAEACFGAPVREIYGCTETGQVAARRTVEGAQWRTLPGVRFREEGERCWAEGGHVTVATPMNDVIELTSPETFRLHGRLADLVNIAGKRTSLAYLNAQLLDVPGVCDGAFFLPDEADNGNDAVTRLTAFVVAPGISPQSLLAALRQRIDPVFLPRPLHLVDVLPRNATGKLPREALSQLAVRLTKDTG